MKKPLPFIGKGFFCAFSYSVRLFLQCGHIDDEAIFYISF
jgi:hypothetical protein